MNHYEILAIISGKYAEPEAAAILTSVEQTIKKHASAFHYSQNLERKKLAYPIQHHSYGTYILMEFDADARAFASIDHEMRHTNELIRYTIVRKEKVGAPKDLERKEQRIQSASVPGTAPVSPRMHVPVPVFAQTRAPSADFIPASPTAPIMQAPLQESAPISPVYQPEKKEEVMPTLDLDAALTPPEEPQAESEDTKKKQKKVTYEELDKKLDEILNNTIL
ncbi:30S ribosomal protein S6 [Candidatus Uhrbacteria bacterium]|nr:30S ribosomal protein S6 [Candidatus Uhrbacteria bacterium]